MGKNIGLTVALTLALMAAVPGMAFAQVDDGWLPLPESRSMRFAAEPGVFVIYQVKATGFSGVSYLGLCYLGGNELALRLYEVASGAELLVTHTFYAAADELEPGTITPVRGDLTDAAASERLLVPVYACLEQWLESRRELVDVGELTVAGAARDLKGTYTFDAALPLTQLRSATIEAAPGETVSLALVAAGTVTSWADPAFFNWTGAGL